MKKPLIVIALVAAGFSFTHAQNNKVVSAKMHLDEYTKDNDTNALKDAKDAIDLAAANDKTKDDPKMYLYRGEVYKCIFERYISMRTTAAMKANGNKMDKQSMMIATGTAYVQTDTSSLCTAVNSFMKVMQLAPKDYYAEVSKPLLGACASHLDNGATSNYGAGKYPVSLAMFEKVLSVSKFLGVADTSAAYRQNIQNAALVADKAQNYPKAIYYYKEVIRLKDGGPQPYNAIIADYNAMKDSVNALAMLKQARAAFPGDVNLLIAETNVYLQAKDNDKAINNLQAAINALTAKNDPSQKTLLSNLYFVLGNTYDRIAHPKDDKDKPLAKPANYDDLFAKAEENYKKAVELTPDNFDEVFDLGALYNNEAAQLNKDANDVPPSDQKKYNALVAKAGDFSKKAQPVLENALDIANKNEAASKTDADKNTWAQNITATKAALIKIYAGTGQTDKIKALQGAK